MISDDCGNTVGITPTFVKDQCLELLLVVDLLPYCVIPEREEFDVLPGRFPPPDPPEVQKSYSLFDQAREAFKKRDYIAALQQTQQAIRDKSHASREEDQI